jgi:hypothetical protein
VSSLNPTRYSSTKRLKFKRNRSTRRILSAYPFKHMLGEVYWRQNGSNNDLTTGTYPYHWNIKPHFRNLFAKHVDFKVENYQFGRSVLICKRWSRMYEYDIWCGFYKGMVGKLNTTLSINLSSLARAEFLSKAFVVHYWAWSLVAFGILRHGIIGSILFGSICLRSWMYL